VRIQLFGKVDGADMVKTVLNAEEVPATLVVSIEKP